MKNRAVIEDRVGPGDLAGPESRTGLESGVRAEPRQSRSRDKRDRILVATGELIETEPYEQITTKEIAARAGVSVGSLYRFFVDKQAIVDALAQHWLDGFIEVMDVATADPPATLDAFIDRVIDAYIAFWRGEHSVPSPGLRHIWFGRVRTQLADGAGDHNDRQLVDRLYDVLTTAYRRPGGAHLRTRLAVAVNVADHLLTTAFRDSPHGDAVTLAELKELLRRYLA